MSTEDVQLEPVHALTVYVTQSVADALERTAARLSITRTDVINLAVRQFDQLTEADAPGVLAVEYPGGEIRAIANPPVELVNDVLNGTIYVSGEKAAA